MLGAAKIDIEPEEIDLLKEVEQAVRMVATLAIEKNIRMKIVEKNNPGIIVLDGRLLGQILNNIIGNAIKFTPKGSVTITIDKVNEIDSESGNRAEWGVVEVKDTGVGIEESFIPHIFDEFKQESEGNARKFEGAGIGLSIAKRLIDLMGAKVEVKSQVGKGTTFILKFPLDGKLVSDE